MRSDTGPQTICARPKARISADIVSWALLMGAPSAAVSMGSAGR